MLPYLHRSGTIAVIFLSLMLFHTGCLSLKPTTDTTHYYTLLNTYTASLNSSNPSGLVLGVHQIDLPGYLESPRMVTRYNEYKLDYSEYNRWAEPIDKIIGRLLQDSLESAKGIDTVSIFPWSEPLEYDYTLKIKLKRFEALGSNQALFQARWNLLKGNSDKVITEQEINIVSEWDGRDYTSFAQAMSESCGEFIRKIEATLEAIIP